MIAEKELQEAIVESLNTKRPNANTCLKLAAFYIIQDHLKNVDEGYSGASDTDFLKVVEKIGADKAWPVMNGLMDTLQIVNPKLYDSTMSKLNGM